MMNAATKEKIFDLILADALKESLKKDFERIDKLTAAETHEFSPEFERKVRKLINSVGRKENLKKIKHIAVKSIAPIAVIFSILSGSLLVQPEVFASVQNVFRSVFDKYDKYEYVGDELTIDNFDNNIRLGYVPEGYDLSDGKYSPAYVMLTYTNQIEKIQFKYAIADGLVSYYDNEHNSYNTFKYNDIEYYYYKSNDKDFADILVWYENGYSFSILAHLPKEELVKIAENLEK